MLTNNSTVVYRWKEWQPGFPMSIDANRHSELPRDIQFDSEKGVDFVLNYSKAYVLPAVVINNQFYITCEDSGSLTSKVFFKAKLSC